MRYKFFNILSVALICCTAIKAQIATVNAPRLKVGFLGCPSCPVTEWNDQNIKKMKAIGFNTLQLNIAWGYRPHDEPLNLEDVVALPDGVSLTGGDSLYAKELRTPEKIAGRAAELSKRVAISRKNGLRTMFHFGAPCVLYPPAEVPDQCISSEATINRYVALITDFHKKFPGVDDLLCYTYDQNAWLCSEFGPCPRCHGVPLHERVSRFVNTMARTWKKLNPKAVFWWEPWEVSAGETFSTLDLLDSTCVGLSLHSNIAEVQIALPADRWFKNMLIKARDRKMPVIGELWTGGPTEEMEPYLHIATPLSTLRALRAINNAGTLTGIKEYYGNLPGKEDPNLRMTAVFFKNPSVDDAAALTELAFPYKEASSGVMKYWALASEAIELFPWDVSWLSREIGKSDPAHLMTAAVLKGASWQTPSWQSTRRSSFMRTDDTAHPNFWMREDVQLRCAQAAAKMQQAVATAKAIEERVPQAYRDVFIKSYQELSEVRRRALAYAYHLRETNLAELLRTSLSLHLPVKQTNVEELRRTLISDQLNQGNNEPIASALKMLDNDLADFLNTYFLPSPPSGLKEGWSITSQ